MTGTRELIPSASIPHLLQQRDAIASRVAQATALLIEADKIGLAVGFDRSVVYAMERLASERGRWVLDSDEAAANVMRHVDALAWAFLMDQTGLRSFLDKRGREEWGCAIHEAKTPELTAANIEATFGGIYEQRNELFERGVIEVFRRLSWNYKTNTPAAFGKRLVMTRFTYLGGYLQWQTASELDDLWRVLARTDGQPEPDHRNGTSAAFDRAKAEGKAELETPYFTLRWFKNGNAHLAFTRPELVDGLNAILARHFPGALPEGRPSR